jgi:hypothetical protein
MMAGCSCSCFCISVEEPTFGRTKRESWPEIETTLRNPSVPLVQLLSNSLHAQSGYSCLLQGLDKRTTGLPIIPGS